MMSPTSGIPGSCSPGMDEVEGRERRVRRRKEGEGKDVWTYDDSRAKSHALHHDVEFVALVDGVLARADLDGFDESVRPLGEL